MVSGENFRSLRLTKKQQVGMGRQPETEDREGSRESFERDTPPESGTRGSDYTSVFGEESPMPFKASNFAEIFYT